MENSGIVKPPVSFWLDDYLNWLPNSSYSGKLSERGRPTSVEIFYLSLYEFLALPERGMKYGMDFVFQYGKIKTSKFAIQHVGKVLKFIKLYF